jgi:hypothetical protein
MELRKNFRQIFGFKGLIRKIFRNKDLSCQRALKMGWGSFEGNLRDRHTAGYPKFRSPLSRTAGGMSVMGNPGVCDEKCEGKNENQEVECCGVDRQIVST